MENKKINIEITCPQCKSVLELHNISDINSVLGKKITCGNCSKRYTITKNKIKQIEK